MNARIKEQERAGTGHSNAAAAFYAHECGDCVNPPGFSFWSSVWGGESVCERGKKRCHDDASFSELIWNNYHEEDGRQWPECRNTRLCLWSMFCVWLWIIGDSVRMEQKFVYILLILWIIIVSTFSPFLYEMDLFAADIQVYTCWIIIPSWCAHLNTHTLCWFIPLPRAQATGFNVGYTGLKQAWSQSKHEAKCNESIYAQHSFHCKLQECTNALK